MQHKAAVRRQGKDLLLCLFALGVAVLRLISSTTETPNLAGATLCGSLNLGPATASALRRNNVLKPDATVHPYLRQSSKSATSAPANASNVSIPPAKTEPGTYRSLMRLSPPLITMPRRAPSTS